MGRGTRSRYSLLTPTTPDTRAWNSREPEDSEAGRRYGDRALMLGTLSILLIWTFGAGLLLGAPVYYWATPHSSPGGIATNSRGKHRTHTTDTQVHARIRFSEDDFRL